MQIDIETFEKTRTTKGIKVPSSLDMSDLHQALAIAQRQWVGEHPGKPFSDDTIRVTANDEYIAIHWTDEETN